MAHKATHDSLRRMTIESGDGDLLMPQPEDVKRIHADLAALERKKRSNAGDISALLKPCEELKINKKAFRFVHTLADMDANSRDDLMRSIIFMAGPNCLNLFAQQDLFGGLVSQAAANTSTPVDSTSLDQSLEAAEAQGYEAGSFGDSFLKNPYINDPDKAALSGRWADGWRRGDAERKAKKEGAQPDGDVAAAEDEGAPGESAADAAEIPLDGDGQPDGDGESNGAKSPKAAGRKANGKSAKPAKRSRGEMPPVETVLPH